MRVSGLAVVEKGAKSLNSRVIRVENIGFDSPLSLLFTHRNTELIFLPED